MSLTMKELTRIFKSGVDDYHGVYLVIAALRDELMPQGLPYYRSIKDVFNEILGGAGEKAAGGPTREDGRGVLASPQTPAADPSPEVCEWTLQYIVQDYTMGCGSRQKTQCEGAPNFCPSCGKPISFKEDTK